MTSTPTRERGPAGSAADSLYIQLLSLLPKNLISQWMGSLSDLPIPEAYRSFVYGEFARQVGANMAEAEHPPEHYPTVNAFFTRRLKDGVHKVAEGRRLLTSPVDGVVSEFGPITNGRLTQTKGRTYSLQDLVGGDTDADAFVGGQFATIYLSPKDYHRIHWPSAGTIRGYRYHPGHLFPVNRPSVAQVDELFCINERVVVFQDAFVDEGVSVPMAVILVGATCVGRMSLAFDELVTNKTGGRSIRTLYGDGIPNERAAEVGQFNLGSTVILLIGSGDVTFDGAIRQGHAIRLGERLATVGG